MPSTDKQSLDLRSPTWLVRAIVSLLVASHFIGILLTYSANWRRSAIQDDTLTLGQPYLIGLNWYVEMLPIDWNRADSADLEARLSVQEKNETERIVLLDSNADTVDRAKKRSLLRLLVSVIEAGDDDGAALLLSSIISHEQASATRTQKPIVSVRLEKLLDAGDANYSVLYEATVKQASDGTIQFLPVLEPQRTVPATRSETSAPAA
ncbi:MAG: hypothetical protein ACK57V_11570 [Pirellula sp.]|jgi:hypothetical protein